MKPLQPRASVMAVASCLALSVAPMVASAAGLGKIVVFSALGQPLRAEIEVTATREELSGMRAQLASKDAFTQAGLDYVATLQGISFMLDKRPSGQAVIKLASRAPINDPFVDMLLELNWPTGRLVREYTFLLDPPEMASKGTQTAAPITPANLAQDVPSPAAPSQTARGTSGISEDTRARALAARNRPDSSVAEPAARAVAPKAAEPKGDGAESIEVRRGDTLHRIASSTKPEGVTLEQMLVGLLRANQSAFDGGNVNRLKAGKILAIPDKSTLEAVSPAEARKMVMAQSADWNAYRGKLAAVAAKSPVADGGASQASGGKITAKVEEKAEPAGQSKDQVKVSKSEVGAAKAGVGGKLGDEDVIAREKALKDAGERVAALEKNVANLQKLVELKDQNLAEMQKQASAKSPAAEPPKAAETPKAVEAPKSAEPPKAAEVPVKAAEPAPAPAAAVPTVPPVPEKPAEPTPPAAAPVPPPAPTPAPVPPPKPAAPPPVPEPSFVDDLMDNPATLAGGAGILALLGGYLVVRRRRANKGETPLDVTGPLSAGSSLMTNSVFRSTGGQSVDTSSHTPPQTDFSQAGPGTIDTDEVDPVAEADVYMAYGRDAQAEEILLEAKQKDPARYAIHLKLLEIYSNRKDVRQFEILAGELFGDTSGSGVEWEKAASMGRQLDPQNPLYGGAASPAEGAAAQKPAPESVANPVFDNGGASIVPALQTHNTQPLPAALAQMGNEAAQDSVPAALDVENLDFDLGLGDAKPDAALETATDSVVDMTGGVQESALDAAPLDFDLAMPESAGEAPSAGAPAPTAMSFTLPDLDLGAAPDVAKAPVDTGLDFDLNFDSSTNAPEVSIEVDGLSEKGVPAANLDDDLEFDVNLNSPTSLRRSTPDLNLDMNASGESALASTPFDMKSIDLDLGTLGPASEPADWASETLINADTVVSLPTALPELPALPADPLSETVLFDVEQVTTSVNPDFLSAHEDPIDNPSFGKEAGIAASDFELDVNEEVSTKLDLAVAYEEMGDIEGARELLQEVVKEGDAAQREKAEAILAKIGA